jgi:hypothetical protein
VQDMLNQLDLFFTLFHSAFVIFVLIGWISKTTRKAHALALLLTFTAWMLLGLYKGVIGYCPLTDWHWDVKRALGETGMSSSFIGYMIEHYLDLKFTKIVYNVIAAAGLAFGVVMAILVQIKFKTRKSNILISVKN